MNTTLGYVELLGRNGEVSQRWRLTQLPCRIGRGYDMDVLLDDPFVAPAHLEVTGFGDEGIQARELGTRNGVFLTGERQPFTEGWIPAGEVVRLGRTQVRIQPAATPVAEEVTARATAGFAQKIRQPMMAAAWVLVMTAMSYALADSFRTTSDGQLDVIHTVLKISLAFMGTVILAGALGKLFSGAANLSAHVSLIAIAFVMWVGLNETLDIVNFSLGLNWNHALGVASEAVAVGWLVYQTSGLIFRIRYRTRWLTVLGAVLVRVVLMPGMDYLDNWEMPTPRIDVQVKPALFLVSSGVEPHAFIDRFQETRRRLDDRLR